MKFRKFVNFVAYIGILVLIIGLALSFIPNGFGDWCKIIVKIAMWIEVAVGMVYAFYFARSREESWFMFGFGVMVIALTVIIIIKFTA